MILFVIYNLHVFSSRYQQPGNLVDWETSEWSLENMISEEINLEEVCQLPKPKDVVFPERRSMIDSKLLCTKLGGKLTVVIDQRKQDELIRKFNTKLAGMYILGEREELDLAKFQFSVPSDILADRFWAGWDDIEQEGFFANTLSGEVLQKEKGFWPFYPGEPNGELLENCATVWTTRNAWNDLTCSERSYAFCHIQTRDSVQEN